MYVYIFSHFNTFLYACHSYEAFYMPCYISLWNTSARLHSFSFYNLHDCIYDFGEKAKRLRRLGRRWEDNIVACRPLLGNGRKHTRHHSNECREWYSLQWTIPRSYERDKVK
jgi:hypothetical protein